MRRVVCGDDAMGTLLLDRGVPVDHCLEELCVTEPNRIRVIHDEYVAAGARVIETNTFGANAVRQQRFGFEDRVAEINNGGGLGRAQGRARQRRLCCRKCRAAGNRRS
jgi:methionine synthase I (cobalamin-dependent)